MKIDKSFKDKVVHIRWVDSYAVDFGWQELEDDYSADLCIIDSWGRVVYEDNKVIALSANYANESKQTTKQVNGKMIIPKVCIEKITSF